MARARIVALSEVAARIPEVVQFNAASVSTQEEDDLFLCALGFEPRCLALPQMLANRGYQSRKAVYFQYATNPDDNEVNRPELVKHLSRISSDIQPIGADDPDFANNLRRLLEAVSRSVTGEQTRVTFDMSATANRFVVTSMAVLLETDVSLRIIYSEAATYHPTEEEYVNSPENWQGDTVLGLERGVSEIRPSREIPGLHLDPLPDAVVLFPSFKAERSRAVISFVDPSLLTYRGDKVVWLMGVPHLNEHRWRLEALRILNDLGEEDVQYEVSTFDYKETLRILENIHGQMSDLYKMTLSPIGSKMQALGTSLFCYIHPDVRVVFAIPKEYNASQYSDGCRATWQVDFGYLPDLTRLLEKVGTLEVTD